MKIPLATILTSAAMLAAQAHADVLFSDDFSASGSGTGFAGGTSWESGLVASGDAAVTASGGDLTVSSPTNGGSNARTFRALDSAITVAGSDFWFVTNITYTGTKPANEAWFGISFYQGGSSGSESLFFGSDTASTNWEFTTSGTDHESSVANFTGNPTLVVAHITGTQIDMWIDPADVSSAASLGAADQTFANSPITTETSWDTIRIGAGNGVASSGYSVIVVSDMTAATTFAEAISPPVNAPSALRITATNFDDTTRTFSLTWESDPSATYTLSESPDLSGESWTEVDNAIPGDVGATTTYELPGLPVEQTKRFYKVSENP